MAQVCVSILLSALAAICHGAVVPWTPIERAAAKVADNSVLRFPFPGVPPFEETWNNFKNTHGKQYKDDDEESDRKEIFRNNLKRIEMHNLLHDQGKTTFRMGVNEYTDMENKEIRTVMNGFLNHKRNNTRLGSTYMSPNVPLDLPKSVDWRTKGYVTPVKNQGHCGSCWSFSSTGSLEGQHFRKTGQLVSLSEQNLVDCSESYGNHGCNGGMMDYAFAYIRDNGGDDTEASYPYEAVDGQCRFKKRSVGATDTGFTDVEQGSESQLQEALATVGPISIAIDASHPSFQMYQDGVYVEPQCSPEALDHGVLVVGYGTTDDGQDYWIVKNSWGETWGKDGYIWMARNRDNQCGVASSASYPNV